MATDTPRNPYLTVDVIIETKGGIVLIKRRNPPYGWAIPGGFVDYGESLEQAAAREAREETRLDVHLVEQFYSYSEPGRDPRFHTVSTVFIATGSGTPDAADDASEAAVFSHSKLPEVLAFDHGRILADYLSYKSGQSRREIFSRFYS